MTCEVCGQENVAGGKFCSGCGAQLPVYDEWRQEAVLFTDDTAPNLSYAAGPPACEFCGQKNVLGEKFCVQCGAQLPARERKTPPAASGGIGLFKSPFGRKLLTIAAGAVAALVLLVILLSVLKGPPYQQVRDSIRFFSMDDAGSCVVSVNNNASFTIDGEMNSYSSYSPTIQYSLDGGKAALLTDYSSRSGGVLWVVAGKDKVKVAEDVLSFRLSDNGGGIAYLAEPQDNTATLYLYNGSKSTKITEEAGSFYFCVSPNGKTVAYITDIDQGSGEFTGYIRQEGRSPEKLGKNLLCVAVADSGKYIYYGKVDNIYSPSSVSFYVRKGTNDVKLTSGNYTSTVFLNEDYSQAVFCYDGKSYISRNGAEKEKLYNSSEFKNIVMPRYAQAGSNDNASIYVCGIKQFANTVWCASNGNLVKITDKYEGEKLITSYSGSSSGVFLAGDGKTLVYIDGSDRLCRRDISRADSESRLAEDVSYLAVSQGGDLVYYVNTDDELWCVRGGGKPGKVADDVSGGSLALSGSTAFFLTDYSRNTGGTLCYSKNGAKKASVSGGDDVHHVEVTATSVFYFVDAGSGGYDVYRSAGDERFSLLRSGIYSF